MNNGVAYFLYCDKNLVQKSAQLLKHEGIEVYQEEVPDYLYSQCEYCLKTSISDSFVAESLMEQNHIFIDAVHKEVASWN